MRGACPKVYGPTEPYCAEKTPLALNYDDPGFRLGSTPNRINSLDSTSTELLAPHVTMECPRGASGSEYFPSFASNLDPLAQSESLLFDFSDTSCDAPRSDYELHPSSMPHGLQISISANNALDAFVTDLTHAPPAIEQSQRMCKQQTLQRNSIHPVNTNNIGFTEHIWTTPSTIRYGNFDILLPNQRVGKRGAFRDSRLRKETAQTRKIGSCIRCRMQRIRVSKPFIRPWSSNAVNSCSLTFYSPKSSVNITRMTRLAGASHAGKFVAQEPGVFHVCDTKSPMSRCTSPARSLASNGRGDGATTYLYRFKRGHLFRSRLSAFRQDIPKNRCSCRCGDLFR